jgi:trimethylamine--corrinoid protein Co-methyltransferase
MSADTALDHLPTDPPRHAVPLRDEHGGDVKSTIVSYGSPEWPLGMTAQIDLARYYDLPAWSAGGASDSKVVGAQAGLEMTFLSWPTSWPAPRWFTT